MRILITGSQGQLGRQLLDLGSDQHQLFGYDLDMDITDTGRVQAEFAQVKPELVIHCAAYTDVDGCEDKVQFTYKVNTTGTENLVREAGKYNADFLFISSDYVFDGKNDSPYRETDKPNPLSVYGDSKYQAEKLVSEITDKHYIVRTTGLYSIYGKNFVDTVIKAARKKDSLSIVDDQVCTPTFSLDLARCIYQLIESRTYGIYHATNAGQCSWYQFTRFILETMGIKTGVNPVASSEVDRKATRPAYSVLENYNLEENQICFMRPWKQAVKDFLINYYNRNS